MGMPAIYQQWCPSTPEMILLPGLLEMFPPGVPIPNLCSRQPNTSPPNDLSGRSSSSTTIPRVEISIGKCTLGVHLVLDRFFTKEFAHYQEQAITWARNITNNPLTRDKVYTAYCCMWRPSFEYPLPITCFSKQQCCTLQMIFNSPFLSKMGISSKTSRKLILTPYHYSGLTFADT
jgi:hypothetical protein